MLLSGCQGLSWLTERGASQLLGVGAAVSASGPFMARGFPDAKQGVIARNQVPLPGHCSDLHAQRVDRLICLSVHGFRHPMLSFFLPKEADCGFSQSLQGIPSCLNCYAASSCTFFMAHGCYRATQHCSMVATKHQAALDRILCRYMLSYWHHIAGPSAYLLCRLMGLAMYMSGPITDGCRAVHWHGVRAGLGAALAFPIVHAVFHCKRHVFAWPATIFQSWFRNCIKSVCVERTCRMQSSVYCVHVEEQMLTCIRASYGVCTGHATLAMRRCACCVTC